MRKFLGVLLGVAMLLTKGAGAPQSSKEENHGPGTVPVHLVATVEPVQERDTEVPVLTRENVQVRQGRDNLQVTDWIPARGDQAALQLFILIDDTSDTSLGSQLGDIRDFIQRQPTTTMIGLGYMRNTQVNIVQNFTTDHALVASSVRLPLGGLGASDSPYLSLIRILQGWPDNKKRREVLMITDGIDRLRSGPRGGGMSRGMPFISPDVDRASREAQRAGVIVHSIFTRGVGHMSRSFFEITNGQNQLARLADDTGGESFFLGTQNAVSFRPYFDRLQLILDNQYFLAFRAIPGRRSDLQRVRTSTEVPRVEIVTADSVWVPVGVNAGG